MTRVEWAVVAFWAVWVLLWLVFNAPSPLDGVHPAYYEALSDT
jgi:hypothetical protein